MDSPPTSPQEDFFSQKPRLISQNFANEGDKVRRLSMLKGGASRRSRRVSMMRDPSFLAVTEESKRQAKINLFEMRKTTLLANLGNKVCSGYSRFVPNPEVLKALQKPSAERTRADVLVIFDACQVNISEGCICVCSLISQLYIRTQSRSFVDTRLVTLCCGDGSSSAGNPRMTD
eukprot:8206119-Pyramimonas_sp.AAC.1